MRSADEIRDSAVLLDIMDWVETMRADPNAQFVMDVTVDRIKAREIIMPCWLFKLVLDDIEIYASDELAKRGIDRPILSRSPTRTEEDRS